MNCPIPLSCQCNPPKSLGTDWYKNPVLKLLGAFISQDTQHLAETGLKWQHNLAHHQHGNSPFRFFSSWRGQSGAHAGERANLFQALSLKGTDIKLLSSLPEADFSLKRNPLRKEWGIRTFDHFCSYDCALRSFTLAVHKWFNSVRQHMNVG